MRNPHPLVRLPRPTETRRVARPAATRPALPHLHLRGSAAAAARPSWIAALCGLLLVAGSGGASAERFTLVKGAPKPAAAQDKIRDALGEVAADLDVCWVQAPEVVRVQLTTDGSGRVTKSQAHTKGGAAQCAAGILAVKTLRGAAKLTLTIDIATVASTALKARSIQDELLPHSGALNGCFDGSAAKKQQRSGTAILRFRINADGSISDTTVQAKALADKALEGCLKSTIEKARLGKRSDGKAISYELGLRFDAAASSATSAPAATRPTAGLAAEKKGPVSEGEIDKEMKAKLAAFTKCYDAVAKKKPSLAGRVVLRYTIKADGSVTNVKVKETTLANADVESCIVRVGNTLRFSSQPGRENTRVVFPFAFQPNR